MDIYRRIALTYEQVSFSSLKKAFCLQLNLVTQQTRNDILSVDDPSIERMSTILSFIRTIS